MKKYHFEKFFSTFVFVLLFDFTLQSTPAAAMTTDEGDDTSVHSPLAQTSAAAMETDGREDAQSYRDLFQLSYNYRYGKNGYPLNPEEANKYYLRAFEEAERYYLMAAENGKTSVYLTLARFFRHGTGYGENKKLVDFAKAEKYYLLAAETYSTTAFKPTSRYFNKPYKPYSSLAKLYHYRQDRQPGDIEKAEQYYLMAAENGYSQAYISLGRLYEFIDSEKAKKYYQIAAEKGLYSSYGYNQAYVYLERLLRNKKYRGEVIDMKEIETCHDLQGPVEVKEVGVDTGGGLLFKAR